MLWYRALRLRSRWGCLQAQAHDRIGCCGETADPVWAALEGVCLEESPYAGFAQRWRLSEVTTPLKDDLLPSVAAIAEYLGASERRVRHLINHGLPAKKTAGRITSRRSWIDAYFAEPDQLAKPAAKGGR